MFPRAHPTSESCPLSFYIQSLKEADIPNINHPQYAHRVSFPYLHANSAAINEVALQILDTLLLQILVAFCNVQERPQESEPKLIYLYREGRRLMLKIYRLMRDLPRLRRDPHIERVRGQHHTI